MTEELIREVKHIQKCLDGLLFDSERIVQRSWEDAGNELGIRHMGSHIYHTLGMNVVGRNEYFLRVIGPDFPKEEFAARTRVRFREIVEEEGLPVKPGVMELLEYGKSRGYKMAVATSSRIWKRQGYMGILTGPYSEIWYTGQNPTQRYT